MISEVLGLAYSIKSSEESGKNWGGIIVMIEMMQKPFFYWVYLIFESVSHIIPDKVYLKMIYRLRMGRKLNIENPGTLNEKLQWIKLYDRKPEYTQMVDKYEMKQYVAKKMDSDKYTIPSYGVWNSFDEIDFDKLPREFALKCTHNSGCYAVCRNKDTFARKDVEKKLKKGLKRNYYWGNREWPYKGVKPRIIAEKYEETIGNDDSFEYKMTCFNGRTVFGTICRGPAHVKLNQRTNDFYDRDFNFLPFEVFNRNSNNPIMEKPVFWDELVAISDRLSEGTKYLRVDCYVINGKPVVGELTFFTWGGFINFYPEEWDYKLGQMLDISAN